MSDRAGGRNSKDLYAGLIFVAAGVAAMVIARDYRMGTTARMGPGYFPTVLGGALVVLGIAVGVRAWWARGARAGAWAVRPLVLVLAAVLGFAGLVQPAGLAVAVVVAVCLSCLAGSEFRPREVLLLAVGLALFSVGVFVYGLGLPFKSWPW